MAPSPLDYLGWSATFVFVASYFCARPSAMRRTQMIGAMMWVLYGMFLRAYPVVVANVMVLAAAAWTRRVEGSVQDSNSHGCASIR